MAFSLARRDARTLESILALCVARERGARDRMVNRKQNLQQRRRGAGRKLEDRAPIVRAAQRGRAVEIAIAASHQTGNWTGPFAGRTAKRMQRC